MTVIPLHLHFELNKCGNGVRTSDENCDDANTFSYDGWSAEWEIEQGYICSGGSTTSSDTWIENNFMPISTLTVLPNNDLELNFNDTMVETTIESSDLYIRVYGPEDEYNFDYTAEYTDNTTVIVYMNFQTSIQGNLNELIVLEFTNTDKFVSYHSSRSVSIENEQSGYLNKQNNQNNTGILGQSAMYIFLISIIIALVSSFGGNSMEMIWGLMNTLQIIYFTSYIYVEYPSELDSFLEYLGWANGNNEYISQLSYLVVSDEHFTDEIVNDKIGEKSFYLNSSDKFPILLVTLAVFIFTFVFDKWKLNQTNKCLKILYKVVEYFKYNFFIRFGLEMFLELFLNSLVSIYVVSDLWISL